MTQEFILVSTIYFISKNLFQFEEFICSLLLCFIFLLILYSEAVVQRFSVKKVFLEILQNTNKLNDKHIWATASGKYVRNVNLGHTKNFHWFSETCNILEGVELFNLWSSFEASIMYLCYCCYVLLLRDLMKDKCETGSRVSVNRWELTVVTLN